MHGTEGYAADGVLFLPAQASPSPAIILVPDEGGIGRRIVEAAANFADAGYVAVAVDLNRGLSAEDAVHTPEQTQHDLDAAVAFLSTQSRVRRGGVGAVGWGSGAIAALRLAAGAKLGPLVIQNPPSPIDWTLLSGASVPILISFASLAGSPPLPMIEKFKLQAQSRGLGFDLKVYPNVRGGFDDPDNSSEFRPTDAIDLRRRWAKFFAAEFARR